jgi:lipoprotein-anchoring transpeptidase ErfK/SrfK
VRAFLALCLLFIGLTVARHYGVGAPDEVEPRPAVGIAASQRSRDLGRLEGDGVKKAPPTTAAPTPAPPPVPSTQPAPQPRPVAAAVATAKPSLVAVANGPIPISREPDAPPEYALSDVTEFGTPRKLLVAEQGEFWHQVYLPVRPNGATGWVPADAVSLEVVHEELRVSLASRELELVRGNETLVKVPAAVGRSTSPTPPGRYYVTDHLAGGGEYGAAIIALNGYSETFSHINGGEARLAIHGTNDPGSIGFAASLGCVRLADDALLQLTGLVPLGTPVVIS